MSCVVPNFVMLNEAPVCNVLLLANIDELFY